MPVSKQYVQIWSVQEPINIRSFFAERPHIFLVSHRKQHDNDLQMIWAKICGDISSSQLNPQPSETSTCKAKLCKGTNLSQQITFSSILTVVLRSPTVWLLCVPVPFYPSLAFQSWLRTVYLLRICCVSSVSNHNFHLLWNERVFCRNRILKCMIFFFFFIILISS